VFVTEVSLGYIFEGTGFSHPGAGTNNWDAEKKFTAKDYLEFVSEIDFDDYRNNLSAIVK
jgi:hypothetical protein